MHLTLELGMARRHDLVICDKPERLREILLDPSVPSPSFFADGPSCRVSSALVEALSSPIAWARVYECGSRFLVRYCATRSLPASSLPAAYASRLLGYGQVRSQPTGAPSRHAQLWGPSEKTKPERMPTHETTKAYCF